MRPSWTSLGQVSAVTVATILGTGILGLPVSLHQSGIQPFLLLFLFNLIAQVCVVYTATELILHAYKIIETSRLTTTTAEMTLKPYMTEDSTPITITPTSQQQQVQQEEMQKNEGEEEEQEETEESPSLHSLANYFIPNRILKLIFGFFVMSHFIFILVTYVLAAPQAYSAIIPLLIKVPIFIKTTVFLLTLSLFVYLFPFVLLPFLSIGTLFKAILLTIIVFLTLITGLTSHNKQYPTSDWSASSLIDPFLMSAMSLGGVLNLMPVTFQICLNSLPSSPSSPSSGSIDRTFIAFYRYASILGVFICFVLNIIWSYSVLLVVPQNNHSQFDTSIIPVNATLQYANDMGQISTIPLMQVLEASDSHMNNVVGFLINLFISISLTISFLVVSIGTLHYINGTLSEYRKQQSTSTSTSTFQKIYHSLFLRFWLGSVLIIYVTAVLNPTGLLRIVEGITSLALNLEAGVFIVYMFYNSRTIHNQYIEESSYNTGFLSPVQAKFIATYMIVFFSIIVFVDVIFYLPKTFVGH